jgi:ABC-type nitrate/sulfonate/bicarbonate transport system substrate-binding protein
MHTIDLVYVGRGIHEELVAQVADQEGYYEEEGVHVAIRDGVSWETERLRRGATIGLGRALLSRLTDGIGWRVLSVNTHRPLFWFLGSAEVTSLAQLRGRRLAVHAASTAPGCFARIVLRKHGLDPDRDLTCVVRAPGDYQMDLRRLRDGSLDAAYVGSTLSPEQVVEEEGLHLLAWVGDHLQIPTVGVAVDPGHIPLDSPALQGLVRANQRALRTIAGRPHLAVDYLASLLGRLTREEAERHYERYVGPYFTPDGQVDLDLARRAIDAVAAELGVASVAADEIYEPARPPAGGGGRPAGRRAEEDGPAGAPDRHGRAWTRP